MNYDLCDLLNRKLEAQAHYLPEKLPSSSIFKNQDLLDKFLENICPEEYLKILEAPNTDHQCFSNWVYRNGKISNQVADFENSARKITRELANLSYSNNAPLDIMYFSGVMKLMYAKNKCMYVECCIRPSLDQLLKLKDLEREVLSEIGVTIWRIYERRGKNQYYQGVGFDSLHSFKWSKIK